MRIVQQPAINVHGSHVPVEITIMQIPKGKAFRHPGGMDLYMRLEPSPLIAQACAPNQCICVNLCSGQIYRYNLTKLVVPVKAVLNVAGDYRTGDLWPKVASDDSSGNADRFGFDGLFDRRFPQRGQNIYGEETWDWPQDHGQKLVSSLFNMAREMQSLAVSLSTR